MWKAFRAITAPSILMALSPLDWACGDSTGLPPSEDRISLTSDFEPRECWLEHGIDRRTVCGFVLVGDDGTNFDGGVRLATMIIEGDTDAATPLIVLAGGPGVSAIAQAVALPAWMQETLAHRDVVLVDQRGTGFSVPVLNCYLTDGTTEGCRRRHIASGVDFDAYNTRRSAADIESVRRALGYETWDIYASSYGTRLALTLARDYPETIRSMVLDGVLPLQVDPLAGAPLAFANAFDALNRSCHTQAPCAERFGDLSTLLALTAERLRNAPVVVSLDDGVDLQVEDRHLLTLVRQLLQSSSAIPYVPAVLAEFSLGDYGYIQRYFGATPEGPGSPLEIAIGTYYSVMCKDEAPFSSRERIRAEASLVEPHFALAFDAAELLSVCEEWSVLASPPSENGPVMTDAPALLISGAFDPLTPPEFASLVRNDLPGATEAVFSTAGHGAAKGACAASILRDFLAAPELVPDTSCIRDEAPLDFMASSPR